MARSPITAPVIARNTIVKKSCSLNDIWAALRLNFGFQSTGAHFIDFCDINLNPDERPEDNLLTVSGGITHHGDPIVEDEDLTPTIENFIVLHWLRLIHPDLPRLVKQRYGTDLRTRTLASLKPEISQALDSLLAELSCTESPRVLRSVPPRSRPPFTSRPAWVKIQSECSSLRRTRAHLVQGTRPSRKLTDIRDVKRYLQVATIARDGLLVVRQDRAFLAPREAVIVPRNVLDGILTALHIQLNHPTAHQLKAVASRYFYALDLESTIKQVTDSCHHCVSLRTLPKVVHPQTTSVPPDVVGVSFAADVLKRSRQFILVLRETVTSSTVTRLIPDEKKETLQTTLLQLCMELRPLDGPPAVIRTDPAPGFSALCHDRLLESYNIRIEVGRPKNMDKNPVAEKAICELEDELLRHDSLGGSVTSLTLSVATARLNSRLRSSGLSAREMLTQRDQFTCEQVPFSDMDLITTQHDQRQKNHPYSVKSKAQSRGVPPEPTIQVGDLVYLRAERSKLHARPRYLVCSIDGEWCNIRKIVGNQLRSSSYRVRLTDCLKVASTVPLPEMQQRPAPDDHDDLDVEPDPGPSDASPGDQPPLATPPVRPPPVPPDVELPRDDLAPVAPSSPDLPAVPPELSNPAHVPPDTSPRTEPSTSSRYPQT